MAAPVPRNLKDKLSAATFIDKSMRGNNAMEMTNLVVDFIVRYSFRIDCFN